MRETSTLPLDEPGVQHQLRAVADTLKVNLGLYNGFHVPRPSTFRYATGEEVPSVPVEYPERRTRLADAAFVKANAAMLGPAFIQESSLVRHEDPWWEMKTKLESFADLSDGWNGYSAPAPNSISIDHAMHFLLTMQVNSCEPTRLAPSAVGGVSITRRVRERKVYVEFLNNGLISALFVDDAARTMKTSRLELSSDFNDAIAEIEEYLCG